MGCNGKTVQLLILSKNKYPLQVIKNIKLKHKNFFLNYMFLFLDIFNISYFQFILWIDSWSYARIIIHVDISNAHSHGHSKHYYQSLYSFTQGQILASETLLPLPNLFSRRKVNCFLKATSYIQSFFHLPFLISASKDCFSESFILSFYQCHWLKNLNTHTGACRGIFVFLSV